MGGHHHLPESFRRCDWGVKGEGPPSPEMEAAKPRRGGSPSPDAKWTGFYSHGEGTCPCISAQRAVLGKDLVPQHKAWLHRP